VLAQKEQERKKKKKKTLKKRNHNTEEGKRDVEKGNADKKVRFEDKGGGHLKESDRTLPPKKTTPDWALRGI